MQVIVEEGQMLIEHLIEKSGMLVTESCDFVLVLKQVWKIVKEFLVRVIEQASD
jgi:hypothetical protein